MSSAIDTISEVCASSLGFRNTSD